MGVAHALKTIANGVGSYKKTHGGPKVAIQISWGLITKCYAHKREGSRVKITLKDEQLRCHRPHPGKEAKRYQVEEVRELLERIGVHP
jgi:hypothetical protein